MNIFLILLALLFSAIFAEAGTVPSYPNVSAVGDTDVYYTYQTGGSHDYNVTAAQLKVYCQNGVVLLGGSYANPSWVTSLTYSKLTGLPSTFAPPIATASVLGGVKQGSGVAIAGDGTISVGAYSLPVATGSVLGGVKAGTGVTIAGDGTISVSGVPIATTSSLGGVIPDGSTITIDGFGNVAVGTVPWSSLSGVPSFATVATSGSYLDLTSRPTLPSGTIVGTSDTQTLTNKSIGAAEINSGTLTVAQGGTGNASLTAYAPLFAGTTSTSAVQSGSLALAGTVLTSNGTSSLPTFKSPGPWTFTQSNLTAKAGDKIWPSGAPLTITLPPSPNDGDTVQVGDLMIYGPFGYSGFSTNNMTVSGNGHNIFVNIAGGNNSTMTLNKDGEIATFEYIGHYGNWFETDSDSQISTYFLALHSPGSPTIAGSTGAGTSPTISISGSDVSGLITVTTGSSPATSATVATVTFNTAYNAAPNAVTLTPGNAAAAALSGTTQVYVSANDAGTFTLTSGSAALTASTQYKWRYSVPQQ